MKLLAFKNSAYEQYKQTVSDNENLSHNQACRKMTRNMLLARKAISTGYDSQLYMYGSLHFLVKDNKVVWISNKRRVPVGWKLNKKEYLRLTKKLAIDEDVTLLKLYIKDVKIKLKYYKNKVKWKLINLFRKDKTT